MGLVQSHQDWIVSSGSAFNQCRSQLQLMYKLLFIESRNFGNLQLGLENIDIFRLKQPPYQSLMKSSRIFQQQSPMLIEFSQTLKKLSQVIAHKNLAPIHFIKIHQQNSMCMKSVKIEHFSTYYAIELRDIIENRKSQDWRFSQAQILYVLKSLINFSLYLKKNNICFGQYQSKNIFTSDNGYLKLYLFHILPQNKHIKYYNLLSLTKSSNIMSFLPIAPEMFSQIKENNLTPNFDYYKAEIFEIGMIILDMIMENSLQRYYRTAKDYILFDSVKVKKDLDQLRQNGLYAQKLIDFLENILQVNPSKRSNLQQADHYLQQLKKQIQFTCKLKLRFQTLQDEDQNIKKISFKSQQPQSQYVLRSIQSSLQQKLNPQPLKSLSKLTAVNQNYLKQTQINKSIYTRRRNTGVSIISSSQHQNNRSMSKRDNRNSKFNTVRNSRVAQHIIKVQKAGEISQVSHFQPKVYCPEKQTNLSYGNQQKISEKWLTLGSTRITQQNNKTLNFLPPKQNKSAKSNPKLQIHYNKQNQKDKRKQNVLISTHIKIHKKKIMSPQTKTHKDLVQLYASSNVHTKQNLSNNVKQLQQSGQKVIKNARSRIKINHHFRA